MSREILIDIPENVPIEFELAGLASRFSAVLIDILWKLMIISLGVLLFIALIALSTLTKSTLSHTVMGFELALFIIFSFVVFVGYNIFFEIKRNGQTPGKRAMGIQVVKRGGYPVDPQSIYNRNLLMVVDFMPMFFFAGIVSILVSSEYQRIGDWVGGTIVIKQRPTITLETMLRPARVLPENLDSSVLEYIRRHASELSPDEYRAVKHFTERRAALSYQAQRDAAMMIAAPIMHRLEITPPPGTVAVDYANLLEYLAVAYEQLKRPLSIA
jgi:uncharacterized RDD family membrane protein YckC